MSPLDLILVKDPSKNLLQQVYEVKYEAKTCAYRHPDPAGAVGLTLFVLRYDSIRIYRSAIRGNNASHLPATSRHAKAQPLTALAPPESPLAAAAF